MRVLHFSLISGLLVLCACDNAPEVIAPEIPDPLYHIVIPGIPDADYSMYYVDLDLKNDLVLKLAQAGDLAGYECKFPYDTPDHNVSLLDLPLEDMLPSLIGQLSPAQGFGWFVNRDTWKWGSLQVNSACWFEWNSEGGFPESAVVGGVMGWFRIPFLLVLKSRGFPADAHVNLQSLDEAALILLNKWTLQPTMQMMVLGELHHEDGLTLLK